MTGLADGLESQIPALRDTLSTITDEIRVGTDVTATSLRTAVQLDNDATSRTAREAGLSVVVQGDVVDPWAMAEEIMRDLEDGIALDDLEGVVV